MDYYEIVQLLKTAASIEELDKYQRDILTWFPCCEVMIGYDQKHRAHQYDLWHHTLHTVLNLPRWIDDDMLFLAALLHDVGKPACRAENDAKNPDAHYYGHPERSAEIVEQEVIPTLQKKGVILTEEEQQRLLYDARYHDDWIRLSYQYIQKHLERVPLPVFRQLLHLQIADTEAHIQLPVIETHIRICKICLAMTGDDYAHILPKLKGNEKYNVAVMQELLKTDLHLKNRQSDIL